MVDNKKRAIGGSLSINGVNGVNGGMIASNNNRSKITSNNNDNNSSRVAAAELTVVPSLVITTTVGKLDDNRFKVDEIVHRKLKGVGKSSYTSPIKVSPARRVVVMRTLSSTVSKVQHASMDHIITIKNINVHDKGHDNINDNIDDDINDNDNNNIDSSNTPEHAHDSNDGNSLVSNLEKANKNLAISIDKITEIVNEVRLTPPTSELVRTKFTLQRPKIEFDDNADIYGTCMGRTVPLDHGVDSPVIITPRKIDLPFLSPPQLDGMTTTKLSPRTATLKKKITKNVVVVPSEAKTTNNNSIIDNNSISVVAPPNQLTDQLSSFEHDEVRSYSRIYYASDVTSKIENNIDQPNFGFDNIHGEYIVCKNDQVAYRYQFLDILGRGSFGYVYKCQDHKSGGQVAMKIIRNRENFRKQAEIESKILQTLKDFKETNADSLCATITLLDSFEFRRHLFLVFPVLGLNLYEYVKQKQQGLSMTIVRSVAIQLIESLVHFRALGIIHCDLKLENILLEDEKTNRIAIIDFGSSCFADATMYSYIQSRFYRAPEVILGLQYSYEIDLWSVGCILPELRSATAAFPGDSEVDQLACIAEVLGNVPRGMIESCKRKDLINADGTIKIVPNKSNELRTIGSKKINDLINARTKDKPFVDFIERCLRWDPLERIEVSDALQHPWLN